MSDAYLNAAVKYPGALAHTQKLTPSRPLLLACLSLFSPARSERNVRAGASNFEKF